MVGRAIDKAVDNVKRRLRLQHVLSLAQIIMPHRSTTYVWPFVTDAVAWSVCRSVRLSVTIVSPAKTAKPIEMPFGVWTREVSRKHMLDGGARGEYD